jgi:hypothetical protein
MHSNGCGSNDDESCGAVVFNVAAFVPGILVGKSMHQSMHQPMHDSHCDM